MATAREITERNDKIIAAKSRSLSDQQVADSLGISTSTVQAVMADFRKKGPQLREVDPVEIIEQSIFELRGNIEELAYIAAMDKQNSVRVGAIRTQLLARQHMHALMQATGVLPHDLSSLKVDLDVRAFSATVLRVFESNGVDPDVVNKVMGEIAKAAGRRPPPAAAEIAEKAEEEVVDAEVVEDEPKPKRRRKAKAK